MAGGLAYGNAWTFERKPSDKFWSQLGAFQAQWTLAPNRSETICDRLARAFYQSWGGLFCEWNLIIRDSRGLKGKLFSNILESRDAQTERWTRFISFYDCDSN